MKYSIYQITFTEKEYNEIIGVRDPISDHPKFEAHSLTTFGKFNEGFGLYNKVAEIEANDLEHVFEISNSGNDEKAITRLARMHSLSAGDIVIDGNDIQWGVEHIGFSELENIIL